jgi:hypothetical protein
MRPGKKKVRNMARKKPISKRKVMRQERTVPEQIAPDDWQVSETFAIDQKGLGPNVAGQSGDTEGLPTIATGDSESVAELVEEGQDLEAEKVSGVENAPDPDEAEVRTHTVSG